MDFGKSLKFVIRIVWKCRLRQYNLQTPLFHFQAQFLKNFHPPTKMGNICVAQKMAITEKAKYAQSVVFNPLILKVDIQNFKLEVFLTLKN